MSSPRTGKALRLCLAWTVGSFAVAVCAARPAFAVTLDVLNEPIPGTDRVVVVQGELVDVYFEVDPAERTSPNDQIQLRRVDDGDLVSYALRGEELSRTVSLSTTPENALGWLEIAYVLYPTSVVLTTSPEKVLVAAEAPPEPPAVVQVPSPEAPTLQAAIDLVADGGTVDIAAGVYDVEQPILVIGKSVTIQGAGSSRDAEPDDEVTLLAAPAPNEVVDAELAIGVITYIGGGGVLTDLNLSGGDACVLGRDLEGSATALAIEDACMSNAGRGVLWKAPSELTVADSKIENCMWNGIVFSPGSLGPVWGATFADVYMQDVENIGYLVMNANAYFEDVSVAGCQSGGIVLYHSLFGIADSHLLGNTRVGVAAYSSAGVIEDTAVWLTVPVVVAPGDERYGDAIAAWICPLVIASGNSLNFNSRSAVVNLGSTIQMDSNLMAGNSFDLQIDDVPAGAFGPSEPPQTMQAVFDDLGGNLCGPTFPPTQACAAQKSSGGMEPPVPPAPIQ